MNFGELRFWMYLLAGLAVIGVSRAGWHQWAGRSVAGFDRVALCLLGLFLLLCVSWVTFAIFLAVTLTTHWGLRWIVTYHARHAAKYLWVLVPLQVLPLVFFKYADFVSRGVLRVETDVFRDLVIPVGISFYTFQVIGFVLDTLALRQPLPGLLDFLNFAGFFPQIVAGPIERQAQLLPQMQQFRFRWLPAAINDGARWIAVGMFFKLCLADNLAKHFAGGPTTNPYLIWWDNIFFGLRIYYDFAGYSLIALGCGRCLGVDLTLNFLSPYCAANPTEFWRRWHITLSGWFRDYLYVPLGGGRVRWWAFNVAVVFIVSGIWHGAGWNFILWGALHAGLLIAHRLGRSWPVPRPVAWTVTWVSVMVAWLYFYERDPALIVAKTVALCRPAAYDLPALRAALQPLASATGVTALAFLGLAGVTLVMEARSLTRSGGEYSWLRRPWVVMILIGLTVWLAPEKNNDFIYFAF
jgi:D-alanyl-lipoteichoic acid acyltransferase DltB (MBOAT superfamily)